MNSKADIDWMRKELDRGTFAVKYGHICINGLLVSNIAYEDCKLCADFPAGVEKVSAILAQSHP